MDKIRFIYLPAFNKEWKKQNLTTNDKDQLESQILEYLVSKPDNSQGHPFPGAMIQGTGGAYKIRFSSENDHQGKSGAYRVLYVAVHNSDLYFLDVFAKNQKENISNTEKNMLKRIIQRLKKG
ncbi:type II toxin-antitoxin system RelE/ParE family toxin [Levilactobacillus zymae]|uniref:type II toxin-antitoxin system RelE/ParE family toxin n=1 Tax=Levilactobacillus zymae TaxID=267363 RepID=UPI000B3F9940|nr:type II toxin-antitoxin system RelE/ParE family toxin [Levilactobacillus zymae]